MSDYKDTLSHYLELSQQLDGRVMLLCDLLFHLREDASLTNESFGEIAALLDESVKKRSIYQHHFFGAPLLENVKDEELKSELALLDKGN